MRLKPLQLVGVAITLALTGCTANQPMTLNSIAVDGFTTEITSHPLYAQADKFSFTTAITKYLANGGHHTVPVGNYLLLNVLNSLPAGVSDVRLDAFNSECNPGRLFLPNVICISSYAVKFRRGEKPTTIAGKVTTDVGLQKAKDDELLLGVAVHRDYGDDSIVGEVKLAVDDVVRDLKQRLIAP